MLGAIQCRGLGGFAVLSSNVLCNPASSREVIGIIRVVQHNSDQPNVKRASLFANKKDRIRLPYYEDGSGKVYHIHEFLNQPTGVESILNVNALESWQSLGSSTYRCRLPKIQLLNFEVSPLLDLLVKPTSEECIVKLLSCKFEGSDMVQRQNEHFSASMKNHITWETEDEESFLDVDVKLNVSLEIYSQPFLLLPVSTIEGPGNIMMQALLDRLVPLLLQQLVRDYDYWVLQEFETAP